MRLQCPEWGANRETDTMNASAAAVEATTKRYGMRGFWALIVTQFQGAFNDNLFQFLIQYTILTVMILPGQTKPDEASATMVPAVLNIVFALPFLIFPGIAGALSDRFSKQRIAVWVKYWEVFIVCFGFFAFYLRMPLFLWVMLFFMASHSAFFSPAKYGILPEILPEEKLSWGNGILQMFTILAIILGTGIAGPLYYLLKDRVHLSTFVLLGFTLMGLATAQFISRPPAANPRQRITLNPWSGMGRYFKILWKDRLLRYTVVGYTYFWFAGALIRANVLIHATVTMGLNEAQTGPVLASMALGIGAGALSAGYLSRGSIELGLVPIGTMGLALFSALLAMPGISYIACLIFLFGLGYFAGFFDVPLAATLQHRSPNDIKGGLMATTNMLTFVGMLIAGALYWFLGRTLHMSTYEVFLITSALSVAVGLYLCMRMPMMPLRSLLWIMNNTLYRTRVIGRENVPITGGALLVGNHVSFLDPGFVSASVDRPVRFLAYRGYYEKWWIKPIAKMFGGIPVAAKDGPRELLKSLDAAREAIKAGELVCLLPEGEITRTGMLQPFRKGFEHVMKGVDAPIIPLYLDGLWGSLFSFSKRRFFRKWPERIPYRITVNIGKPVAATTTRFELRQVIQELGAETYTLRKMPCDLLHRGFLRTARRHPRLLAVADARSGNLSYIKALTGSIALARKLKRILDGQSMVGVIVPPSAAGALTNIALQFMGRVPVNLNYTASAQTIASCARKCHITHCITARAFLERFPVEIPGTPIYLEDVRASVTKKDQLAGLLLALLCPVRMLERICGTTTRRSGADIATVIFSSGSEGEPKGVILTHAGINHNIGSLAQVVDHKRGDVMMGFLPFFHSFGFVGTLWVPLTRELSAVYHPSPLEPKTIGQLVRKYKAFFFVATPTFLQNFTRKCAPEDMRSLRFVMCGAEKMPDRVRDGFNEKFGIEPLEGYGTTECGPAVSLNVPDFRAPGYHQKGFKRGAVGRAIPGVAVRVIDQDTGKVLGPNEPGLLEVKGPSLMQGYLGMPEKTDAVVKQGWYSTGDIAFVDEDGFITITDRLARFSKIGGEMISHTNVEGTLHDLLGLTEQAMAVTGVPDEVRGERLVVLHTLDDGQLNDLLAKLDKSDLPNLWKPRAGNFHRIDSIPVLGTGKIDIKGVKQIAAEVEPDAKT